MPPPLRVLIVEDNPEVGDSIAEILGIYGHVAVVARTGAAAVKLFQRFPADAVCLDIGLPDIDGYETAKRLREVARRPLLLVAFTGYGGLEERSRAEGFDYHFLKPLNPADLSTLLWAYAEQLAGERAAQAPPPVRSTTTPPRPDSAAIRSSAP